MELDLKGSCPCGKKNITTLDQLKGIRPSHTGIRCPACGEKKMVSIKIEVEDYSEWMSKNLIP